VLVEEQVRQGENLSDALKHVEHMRARDREQPNVEKRPVQQAAAAPPDASVLAQLRDWNQMR
jgi:hypothetical protein